MIERRVPLKRSATPARRRRPNLRRASPRRGRVYDPKYLNWIRGMPCVVCELNNAAARMAGKLGTPRRGAEAAHVGDRGLGQKCSDRETIPLCADHHRIGPESHHVLGKKFWEHHRLNRDDLTKMLNEMYDRATGLERAC